MFDQYFFATDRAVLSMFCKTCTNVIGPMPGRQAVPESMDDNGDVIPAIAAAGEPQVWYAAVRSDCAPLLPEAFCVCEASVGQAVLGVWAE